MNQKPPLSVVVVTADRFASIRKTVDALREQTIADQIELIVVGPEPAALEDMTDADAAGFGSMQTLFTGAPIENVDHAGAVGLLAGESDVVAIVEDHAYPEPGWAQAVVDAHHGPWALVGAVVVNANPASPWSWSNQLMAYGEWTEPVEGGEMSNVSRHNVSFKRSVIEQYGDDLGKVFARGGGLLPKLRDQGQRFLLCDTARVRHLNPSRFRSTAELRFLAGWLEGGTRSAREGWSPVRRAIYTLGSPLIPVVRFMKVRQKVLAPIHQGRRLRLLGAVLSALALDAAGQAIGFCIGPGRTEKRLADFEHDRGRHLTAADRRALEATA